MQKSIKYNKIDKTVIIGFLIALGIIYCTMNENLAISSSLISFSFVYVFVVFLYKSTHNTINKSYIKILWLSCVLVFLNTSLSGLGGFDYYKKAIMYMSTIVWMFCGVSMNVSKKTTITIVVINLCINCLYLLFFKRGFSVYEGEVLLTLNFPNPNQTGMFLLNSILYIGILIVAGKDLVRKKKYYIILLCLLIPLLVSVCQLLILTGCRSSFMSLALFFILVLFDYVSRGHFKLKKWMSLAIAVLPFIFIFIYLSYVSTLNIDVSMGMENEGKSSTTRVHIWKPIIDNFWHYFIIGDYYGISNGTGMSQMHNTHLDVYASYGIIPLILYIIILYKVINHSMNQANSRFQRISLYAFVSCMVSCMFEASLVAGSAGMFLLTVGFFILANSNIHYESPTSKLCLPQG